MFDEFACGRVPSWYNGALFPYITLTHNSVTNTDWFKCHGCGADVKLRSYPHGTYDYYSCYRTGTAHNRIGGIGPILDGFIRRELYFCKQCSISIEEFFKTLGGQK